MRALSEKKSFAPSLLANCSGPDDHKWRRIAETAGVCQPRREIVEAENDWNIVKHVTVSWRRKTETKKNERLVIMKLYTFRARVSRADPDLLGRRKEFSRAKNIQLRGSFQKCFSVLHDPEKASCKRRLEGARSQSNNIHCVSRARDEAADALESSSKQKNEI